MRDLESMNRPLRYLLAFGLVVTVSVLFDFFTDPLVHRFAPAFTGDSQAEVDAWRNQMLMMIHVQGGLKSLVAFAVGAFVLRRGSLVPAIALWVVMTVAMTFILRSIAYPANSSTTYWEIVSYNAVGWAFGLAGVIAGVLIGESLARRRGAGAL